MVSKSSEIEKEVKNEDLDDAQMKRDLVLVFESVKAKDFSRPDFSSMFPEEKDKDKRNDVIWVSADAKLKDAMALLNKYHILAAPVRDEKKAKEKDSKWLDCYIGMLEVHDIVAFVLEQVKRHTGWGEGFETVFDSVTNFVETTVRDVVGESESIPFPNCSSSSTMRDVMLLLGKYRYHRIIITDVKQELIENIITQSAVVRALLKHMDSHEALTKYVNRSITSLGLAASKTIIHVNMKSKAIDAFRLVHKHGIGGVAVVDDDQGGKIVGNISARDIRTIVTTPALFHHMFDLVPDFLRAIRKYQNDERALKKEPELRHVEFCRPNDTLRSVLKTFGRLGIHRLYVVDEKEIPLSVISLTDVINIFVAPTEEDLYS